MLCGETLEQLRKLAGLSQWELSNRTGVDRSKLSLAESGYVKLNRPEQLKVRTVLAEQIDANYNLARYLIAKIDGRELTPNCAGDSVADTVTM